MCNTPMHLVSVSDARHVYQAELIRYKLHLVTKAMQVEQINFSKRYESCDWTLQHFSVSHQVGKVYYFRSSRK